MFAALALPILFLHFQGEPHIDPGGGIDDELYLNTDGARLFMKVRGHNRENPFVLFLHGGPGDGFSVPIFQEKIGNDLEKSFTVVYLYQRGVLFSSVESRDKLTIENNVNDVHRVVSFIEKKYNPRAIHLLGHSWGGTLTSLYLLRHRPASLQRIALAAPLLDRDINEFWSYRKTLAWATKSGRTDALNDLQRIGPPPYKSFQDFVLERKWAEAAQGGLNIPGIVLDLLLHTDYDLITLFRFRNFHERQQFVSGAMWSDLMKMKISASAARLDLPLLVITGSNDFLTPHEAIAPVFDKAPARQKRIVRLQGCSHMLFLDCPAQFRAEVEAFFK